MFTTALAPAKSHELDERHVQESRRDDDGDAGPPRSTVDLDTRVARLRLPDPPPDAG